MTFRSKPYRDYVASHDCCACGVSPENALIVAHHCAPPGISPAFHGGGRSQKMDDHWTVPVCDGLRPSGRPSCHKHWHASNTYRQFPGMSVAESDALIAVTQLKLMSRWILLVDPRSDLF